MAHQTAQATLWPVFFAFVGWNLFWAASMDSKPLKQAMKTAAERSFHQGLALIVASWVLR